MIPHFRWPLSLGADGTFATVEQDTLDDVGQCVAVLVLTRRGERVELPEYGIPAPLFDVGRIDQSIAPAIERWERRANVETDEAIDELDELVRNLQVRTAVK